MGETWDRIKNEIRIEVGIEIAQRILKDGKLSYEEIADCTGLSLDKVIELAGNKSA